MAWGEDTLDILSGPNSYSLVILSSSSAKGPWNENKLYRLGVAFVERRLSDYCAILKSLFSASITLWIRKACVSSQQWTLADTEWWVHIHILCPPLSVNSWHPHLLPAPTITRTEHDTHIQQISPPCLPASRPVSYALHWKISASSLIFHVSSSSSAWPGTPQPDTSDAWSHRVVMAWWMPHDRGFHLIKSC